MIPSVLSRELPRKGKDRTTQVNYLWNCRDVGKLFVVVLEEIETRRNKVLNLRQRERELSLNKMGGDFESQGRTTTNQ